MKPTLLVYLLVTLTAAVCMFALTQTPAPTKGISVELPKTTSAATLADADNPDAWILTVTRHGTLFFGTLPGKPEELFGEMQSRPRHRAQEIYIKADAQAPFDKVERALDLARQAMFRRAYMLTSQPSETQSATPVPPKGLLVWFAVEPGSHPSVLTIATSDTQLTLKLDDQKIAENELQNRLQQLLQSRAGRNVIVKTASIPWADVVRILDICNLAGAEVVIEKQEI